MRVLLIDNYDSFTYNLVHLIAAVTGVVPEVMKNDDPAWCESTLNGFDAVVISPGPGRPDVFADVGRSADALAQFDLPILGVCLGHQLMNHYFGGETHHSEFGVMHGRTSEIFHNGADLFLDIPNPFHAVRYHSLVATDLPPELLGTAFSANKEVMALRHRERPIWGVQFHPESICTEYGAQLIRNFQTLATRWNATHRPGPRNQRVGPKSKPEALAPAPSTHGKHGTLQWRQLERWIETDVAFTTLFKDSTPSFWLDSAAGGRFSYMGDTEGPEAEVFTYRTGASSSFFAALSQRLAANRTTSADLPFDFQLGYVGYLGYELKAETGGRNAHESSTPDATLMLADRMVAFDHQTQTVYLVALPSDSTTAWFDQVENALNTARHHDEPVKSAARLGDRPFDLRLRHAPDAYADLIDACRQQIHEGESYEICLTNAIYTDALENPLLTYMTLRRINPAPLGCFFRFTDFAILGSSPESFLRIDRSGAVEARPIKGTAARGQTEHEDAVLRAALAGSEKERAENLMIVDLLRNDLSVVCEVGSVDVPELFAVETYATVHQLVSTVTGRLRPDCSPVDCVEAAFPGGSMTGAPKVRTMEILDWLEGHARGIYSGAIGYFSWNGAVQLNIAIRTMVATSEATSIGVGGAITSLSDPAAEFQETMLKAEALLESIRLSQRSVIDSVSR